MKTKNIEKTFFLLGGEGNIGEKDELRYRTEI